MIDIFVSLPEEISLLAVLIVTTVSFFSAALTAAFGIGGGLLLLAIMSAIFPAAAVIPIHGVAQFGANLSRFWFQLRDTLWPIVGWFSAGSLIGAAVGGQIAVALPPALLKAGVAIFILWSVWGLKPQAFTAGARIFFSTGAVAAFLSMFFGATGPIAAAVIGSANLDKLQTSATLAACMFIQHGIKILTFGLLGFAYGEWLPVIAAILACGFAGSFVGTRLLRRMNEKTFRSGFKKLLTVFAIYLLASALLGIKTS